MASPAENLGVGVEVVEAVAVAGGSTVKVGLIKVEVVHEINKKTRLAVRKTTGLCEFMTSHSPPNQMAPSFVYYPIGM
jgi:hypothetical protein